METHILLSRSKNKNLQIGTRCTDRRNAHTGQPRKMWRTLNSILDRNQLSRLPTTVAQQLLDFFQREGCYFIRPSWCVVRHPRRSPVMDPVFFVDEDQSTASWMSSAAFHRAVFWAQYCFCCTQPRPSTSFTITDWRAIVTPMTHASMFM